MEYRSIKVPATTYDAAQKVRKELVRRGLDNLPKGLSALLEFEKCPTCGSEMKRLDLSYSYHECTHCGYKQQSFDMNGAGIFALGAIFGLGIIALLYLLRE